MGRLSYYVENDKLYVKDNPEKVANIKNGSEIIAINNLEIEKLLKNTNHLSPVMVIIHLSKIFDGEKISYFFHGEYGIMDSVKIDLKSENT